MPTHDIAVRRIAWVGAAIAGIVVLAVVVVWLLLHAWHLPVRADRVQQPYQERPDAPALQSAPQSDLAQYRAGKQRALQGSARVDERTARIPIATAMDLLAHPPAAGASAPEAER